MTSCLFAYDARILSILLSSMQVMFMVCRMINLVSRLWNCIIYGFFVIPNEVIGLLLYYFYRRKNVLRETENVDDGIGLPEWRLTLCLFCTWLTVFLTLVRGVKNSGVYSYFLAIFPYVILLVLLIRAVTLPGAGDGILYFVKPNFNAILEHKVSKIENSIFSKYILN